MLSIAFPRKNKLFCFNLCTARQERMIRSKEDVFFLFVVMGISRSIELNEQLNWVVWKSVWLWVGSGRTPSELSRLVLSATTDDWHSCTPANPIPFPQYQIIAIFEFVHSYIAIVLTYQESIKFNNCFSFLCFVPGELTSIGKLNLGPALRSDPGEVKWPEHYVKKYCRSGTCLDI